MEFLNKKIKFKDEEGYNYTGNVSNYESSVDSESSIGEFFIDIETSNNPEVKEGQGWIFKETEIKSIEIIK